MLHVACSTNLRFAPDCAVMLVSLVATNRAESIHVHLLHDDSLAPDRAAALRELVVRSGGCCDVIEVSERDSQRWPVSDRFPANAWHRVWLADLLPQLSRVVYVDADVLFRASLRELWETDLAGNVLGAVTQYLYPGMAPRITRSLGLGDVSAYFNSGVLLIDLQRWRDEGVTHEIAEFARSHALVWPDQDALSGVLHARRLYLHPRWNAMPGIWDLPARRLPYRDDETREACARPAVVHFLGPHKPWHYRSKSPFRAEWFDLLRDTPWRDREIEGRSLGHALLRPLPSLWAYKVETAVNRWPALARLGGARIPSGL